MIINLNIFLHFIGDVKALDQDRSDSITYSIQSDNLLQLFSIDSLSGEVWSRHMFDRELKSNYEIPIAATDTGGRAGFTKIIVEITDINDNHPKFELEEYKANVFANLTKGKLLISYYSSFIYLGEYSKQISSPFWPKMKIKIAIFSMKATMYWNSVS